MIRRTIAVACFIAAFAATGAVAQAAPPHWIWAKPVEELPQGKAVPISTEGNLGFTIVPASGKKTTTKCKVEDRELIENPIGGGPGIDTMTAFVLSGCGKAACSTGALILFEAAGLPWATELIAGTPIRDEIKGVQIQEQCGGLVMSTFEGNLTPEVKNYGGLTFGPGSGILEDAFKNKMEVKGTDKLLGPPPKSKIGAL